MPNGVRGSALRQIHALYSVGTFAGLGDGPLLERFATLRGEEAELAFAKDRVIKGFPARFESIGGGGLGPGGGGGGGGLAGTLAEVVLYDLPADYFTTYRQKVEAVTQAEVERVARKYLDPSRMAILIVGDRAKVEPTIKDLPFAKVINILDTEGNPVAASPKADAGN